MEPFSLIFTKSVYKDALTTCSPTSTELAFLSCWASLLLTWLVLASEAVDGPHGTLLAIEPVDAEEAGPAGTTGVEPGIPGAAGVAAEAANDADDVEFVVALGIMTKVKVPVIWHSLELVKEWVANSFLD